MSEAPQPPPSGDQPSGSGGSRSLWMTVAIGLGAIVLAGILYLVLRPDDSEPAAETTSSEAQPTTTVQTTTQVTTTQATTTTVATTTVETTTTTPEDQPQRVNVRFENGEVVGGLVTADIEEGARVVLSVRADVTDEVHLHGYDLSTDVVPGQVARITFTADQVGVFEVELEELGVPIAELSVS
jgi:heme/copper-type cytochrome/quinol oxidase subunit 2